MIQPCLGGYAGEEDFAGPRRGRELFREPHPESIVSVVRAADADDGNAAAEEVGEL
jgi:hypothetical protein